jgi:Tol biopolymer transport system component
MKRSFILLLFLFSLIMSGCNKDPVSDNPQDDGPFKVTARLPLPDNIPYDELGSGKIVFERNYGTGGSDFYVIDIKKRKSSGFTLESSITQPNVSPEGTKIACSLLNSADSKSKRDIYIMNIDGSDCFPAFKSKLDAVYPTWTSDGSKIVFYTSGPGGKVYLQSALENSPDTAELIKLSYANDPDWLIKPAGGFSMSQSGKLASVSTSENPDGVIDIVPYTGKAGVKVLINPSTDLGFVSQNFKVQSAVYSPDGLKIAFIDTYSNPEEPGWISINVNTIDTDGTNLISLFGMGGNALKSGSGRQVSLCWSPDGTKIIFNGPDTESSSHLIYVNTDGSGWGFVTNQTGVYDGEVSWSK